MLEHVPHWLGALLRNVRAGADKLAIADTALAADATIDLMSPAFAHGARLPERFTADGAGVSPPLVWGALPAAARALALLVEDPDAPAPQPLIHAVVWNIPADAGRLAEGAIVADGDGGAGGQDVGKASFGREGWLPPDPPTGHGAHDYAFQLFALDAAPHLDPSPSRADIVAAMRGHVIASGLLIGTYSRGETAVAGPIGARPAVA